MSSPVPASARQLAEVLQNAANCHYVEAMRLLHQDSPVTGTVNTHLMMAVYEQNAAILCLLMEGRKPCE